MKYLYLFFIYLLVNSDCPNLCSGHGSCSATGKCVCNTQPGLGLNKGVFDEFSWTGSDCSMRTCPKGQSFSYDIYKEDINDEATKTAKFLKSLLPNSRLLFESDNARQAAQEEVKEEETPTDAEEPIATTPTKSPSVTPTTIKPTTTSPEIVTKAPIVVTPPETPTLPEEERIQPINNSSLTITNTTDIPQQDRASSQIIIFNENTGEIVGIITVEGNETITVGDALDQLGITDVSNIKIAEKVKTYAETTPTVSFIENVIQITENDASGKPVIKLAAPASPGMKNKLNTLFKDKSGNRLRMLTDGNIICGDTTIPNNETTKMWCVESENPKDNNYFKMRLLELNLGCYAKNGENKATSCSLKDGKGEGDGCEVYVTGPAAELEDIGSACFYLGDKDAKIEDAEIYSLVGERGGDYYFARYTEDATVIAAVQDQNQETGSYTISYNKSPSLVGKLSYPINRPIGDVQKSMIPGAKMTITKYNAATGSLNKTTITIDNSYITSDGKLVVEVPESVDMNVNGTESDDGGDDDTTGTDSRRLWEGRQLEGTETAVFIRISNIGPHGVIECSGRGNCDRTTGQCQCYEGFEGDACQRTSCPNNCNNNGRCVVLNEALGFNINTRTTDGKTQVSEDFDTKLYGCLCDEGHRGADCSLYECPSDKDPSGATNIEGGNGEFRDCSGRGVCDYTTGTCTCFDGYYGTACETMASFT